LKLKGAHFKGQTMTHCVYEKSKSIKAEVASTQI